VSSNKQQTFNRSDIELALIKEFPRLSKSQISLAIDSILESIVDAVALDDKVEIRGFGTFSKKIYKT
jgi:integration host factor subunit beta